jgi:hypothetical protein
VSAGERIAELEVLVARLQATVAELTAQNEELRARNAELEERLGEARRAGKRQAAPFSKGAPKADPERPGRKSGKAHGRHGHRAAPVGPPGTWTPLCRAAARTAVGTSSMCGTPCSGRWTCHLGAGW